MQNLCTYRQYILRAINCKCVGVYHHSQNIYHSSAACLPVLGSLRETRHAFTSLPFLCIYALTQCLAMLGTILNGSNFHHQLNQRCKRGQGGVLVAQYVAARGTGNTKLFADRFLLSAVNVEQHWHKIRGQPEAQDGLHEHTNGLEVDPCTVALREGVHQPPHQSIFLLISLGVVKVVGSNTENRTHKQTDTNKNG